MRRYLSVVLLNLLSVINHLHAQGVRECERLTLEDLTSTDNSQRSSILVQVYNTGIGARNPFIQVEDMHIVCEVAGAKRDTYRAVSVIVRHSCVGLLCPPETRDKTADVQYDFECSTINEWIARASGQEGEHIRELNPEADFDTEPVYNCSACARAVAGADPVTHCRRKSS